MSPPNNGVVDTAHTRITNLLERCAILLLTIVLSFVGLLYNGQQDRIKEMESRVLVLQTSKVDKEDLKDVENRINFNISAMKSDILSRLDLYFQKRNP